MILAQNSSSDNTKPQKNKTDNQSEKKSLTLKEKINNYKKKREKLLDKVILRNKVFGEAFAEFTSKSLAERQKLENDLFVPYTDIHIPPSELFTEKLLVARHSKLCLGQNASGKITFHACNENTGGLLWATKKVLIDPKQAKSEYMMRNLQNNILISYTPKFFITGCV